MDPFDGNEGGEGRETASLGTRATQPNWYLGEELREPWLLASEKPGIQSKTKKLYISESIPY